MTVRQYRYTVLFEPAEEGGYVVTCPSLPGLVTEGDTLEEACDMAADAIRGYLESLTKDGLPIPPEDPLLHGNIIKETVAVAIEQEWTAFPLFDRVSSFAPWSELAFLCTTCGAETTTFGIRKNPGVLVTIPYHNRDLKRGTLRSILRQAGIASANQAG